MGCFRKALWWVALADGDYHLAPGSPAIDAGSGDDALADDLEGNARPVGAGVDIGAYEG